MGSEQRKRRGRVVWVGAAILIGLLVVVGGVALIGNDYRISLSAQTIDTPGARLEGVLALPPDKDPAGVVLMVHGDGPVDAENFGFYLPWFEAAADAGFATLSWSKPGVGASEGNWLDQSMADRSAEVADVIDWARENTELPMDNVVLWGASQAGWVVPGVAAEREEVTAVIGVGVAINWLRQGRYNLLAELDADGATPAERESTIAISDQTRSLLQQGADYQTYRDQTHDPEPMTAGRWGFALLNYASDATADLEAMAPRELPVQLLLGEHDRNVDVGETADTYADILGEVVQVTYVDSAHSMAKPIMEENAFVGAATDIFWPRALLADGVLEEYRNFLVAMQ